MKVRGLLLDWMRHHMLHTVCARGKMKMDQTAAIAALQVLVGCFAIAMINWIRSWLWCSNRNVNVVQNRRTKHMYE
jgi:hypothetical protein